jgi:hypothetical protein
LIERTTATNDPAPSLRPHRVKQRHHRYYEPVRQRIPQRYSVPNGFRRSEHSLSPPLPKKNMDDSVGMRFLTFRVDAADRAHAAYMPDTTWPINGHPPGSSRSIRYRPGFDVNLELRHFNSYDATSSRSPPDAFDDAFSHIAHHNSLQLMQQWAVWYLPPQGDTEGPNLHHPHSTPSRSYLPAPFRARDARRNSSHHPMWIRSGGRGETSTTGGHRRVIYHATRRLIPQPAHAL